MLRHNRIVIASVAGVLALAGCSGGAGSGGQDAPAQPLAAVAPGPFNAADVEFAKSMIPHQQQAADLAALADGRTADPEVTGFAARIRDAQDPVIARLSALLEAWGQPAPEDPGLHLGAPGAAPGMLTVQEMADLEAASGAQFDERFLDMMERHQKGALDAADAQRSAGTNAQAREVADGLAAARQGEIGEIQRLRAG